MCKHTRIVDVLTEVFPTKSTSGEGKREKEEGEEKRKGESGKEKVRERERETHKDADINDNSRSFAYYRSPPIPTLWAEEHISTIIEEYKCTTYSYIKWYKWQKENKIWELFYF